MVGCKTQPSRSGLGSPTPFPAHAHSTAGKCITGRHICFTNPPTHSTSHGYVRHCQTQTPHPPKISGQISPTSPMCSADLLGLWDFADHACFCRWLVFRGVPGINNVIIGAVRALCENAPHGVMVSWCHGVMVSSCHGVIVSWCHGVMVSWCHGLMVSWCHGVMVSWCHGVMVSSTRFCPLRSGCPWSRPGQGSTMPQQVPWRAALAPQSPFLCRTPAGLQRATQSHRMVVFRGPHSHTAWWSSEGHTVVFRGPHSHNAWWSAVCLWSRGMPGSASLRHAPCP